MSVANIDSPEFLIVVASVETKRIAGILKGRWFSLVGRPSNVPDKIGTSYFPVGRPINVPDKIGTSYFPVGRPINVPDKIGTSYFPVGRNLFRHEACRVETRPTGRRD
jgi:hypothetical protein